MSSAPCRCFVPLRISKSLLLLPLLCVFLAPLRDGSFSFVSLREIEGSRGPGQTIA